MDDIQVYPIGTKCALVVGDSKSSALEGVIIGIKLMDIPTRVVYEIEWWSGNEMRSGWFYEFQITPKTTNPPKQIGFKNG